MIAFISRVLIVAVVFLAGALVGNIYMPQKQLESAAITSIGAPKTSLDLEKEPSIESALKAIAHGEAALTATGESAEAVFAWHDLMQRAVLVQAYRAAKAQYELEMLKTQGSPTAQSAFLKAQEHYLKISAAIEAAFPLKVQEEIEIISPAAPAANGEPKPEK